MAISFCKTVRRTKRKETLSIPNIYEIENTGSFSNEGVCYIGVGVCECWTGRNKELDLANIFHALHTTHRPIAIEDSFFPGNFTFVHTQHKVHFPSKNIRVYRLCRCRCMHSCKNQEGYILRTCPFIASRIKLILIVSLSLSFIFKSWFILLALSTLPCVIIFFQEIVTTLTIYIHNLLQYFIKWNIDGIN